MSYSDRDLEALLDDLESSPPSVPSFTLCELCDPDAHHCAEAIE